MVARLLQWRTLDCAARSVILETLALRLPWGSTTVPVGELIFLQPAQGCVHTAARHLPPKTSLKGPTPDRPGDPGGVPQVEAFTL